MKDVTFRVPVGRMCVVAGVSGSGKSTLVRHVFFPALRRALGLVADEPGEFSSLKGTKALKRALAVDQSPIGRTPRSVPATFLGVWDEMRRLFASMPEAKARGFGPARFSFNTATGGRCPSCEGQGVKVAEMAFLPDVIAPCEDCGGARFEPGTLDVKYTGLSIGDVLHLSAEDAAKVFVNHPRMARPLETLREPTTGLHLSDVRRLLSVLERLVARGDTLVVIEHHPDVIACADWVVELGPEAGANGGEIVFAGEPKKLSKAKTATGRYLGALASAG